VLETLCFQVVRLCVRVPVNVIFRKVLEGIFVTFTTLLHLETKINWLDL